MFTTYPVLFDKSFYHFHKYDKRIINLLIFLKKISISYSLGRRNNVICLFFLWFKLKRIRILKRLNVNVYIKNDIKNILTSVFPLLLEFYERHTVFWLLAILFSFPIIFQFVLELCTIYFMLSQKSNIRFQFLKKID